jgi:EmrB/QacA subfamily drug resistance transporter
VDAQYARRYAVLSAIMLGNIMGPIDASIVNVILPTIADFFHASIATAQWVPMIYLLTISSLLLLYGRLGDIFGYKRVYLLGLAGFIVASALCGLSPTIRSLILFRGLQGLAAGTMMAVPFAILTASFPPAQRGRALGINAVSVSAGLAIGPSLGGFVTSVLGWRFAFLINIPIGIFGLLWARRVLPDLKGEPGKLDLCGATAAFVSLSGFLLFVNRSQGMGVGYGTGLLLAVAVLAGVTFVWIERRSAHPMLDLGLFRDVTFSFANVSALLNFICQYVMVFLTPFYLQRALHRAPRTVGLIMTSFPLAVMAVAPFSGALSDRIGTRGPACAGAATCALSLCLMGLLPPTAGARDVVWRLALFGLGTGLFQSPNNSAVMGSAPRPHLGVASGILATMRNMGMVLGVAAAGAALYAFVPPEILEKPALETPEVAVFLRGLRYAYATGAAATGLAAATSLIRTR